MKKFKSIQTKMISSTMTIIFVLFLSVLTVIVLLNIINVNANVLKSEKSIHKSLIAKGSTLIKNNSMAMRQMVADNAFTAIGELVSETAKEDNDIIYGIYMDLSKKPWVYADSENPSGDIKNISSLSDATSNWAASIATPSYKEEVRYKNRKCIEFAAPVYVDDEIYGWIRYGISTSPMDQAIAEVRENGKESRNKMIAILSCIGLLTLAGSFLIVKRQTQRITDPIRHLMEFSKIISDGDYNVEINVKSNDEIGELAEQFEDMRGTIKKYTDHLQELVDEKMQQVKDILDNIDQGLFTVNLDGTLNDEYSAKSNEILKVPDLSECDLAQLLRMDGKQAKDFEKWLGIVEKRHQKQRWEKLAHLAPVKELVLRDSSEDNTMNYVSISYQKIQDRNNALSKIMILAVDETEKRLAERKMHQERIEHEKEVKMILSIANTPPDEMAEFMEDTQARLETLQTRTQTLMDHCSEQRRLHPDGPIFHLEKEQVDQLYRDLHTIKGNAGSYNFEQLAAYAHQAEDLLEMLRGNNYRREYHLQSLLSSYEKIKDQHNEILGKVELLFGKQAASTIQIPQSRIQDVVDLCNEIKKDSMLTEEVKTLIDMCDMLTWKPLSAITRKYQKIIQKSARRSNKEIRINIKNDKALFPPNIMNDIDEVLIHLFRNVVDHGIETPEAREELGKGVGTVDFEFSTDTTGRIVRISDDGRGIDTEMLVEKSVATGFLTKEEARELNESQKLSLIFKAGVSASEEITDTSGRGMGMNIVKAKIDELGGDLKIQSESGKGTAFSIHLPPNI